MSFPITNTARTPTGRSPSPTTILYDAKYRYDIAGRLVRVTEPLQSYDYRELAGFQYDDNGNRESLTCFLNGHEGATNSPQLAVNYEYNFDNLLWRYTTTTTGATGPTFAFGGVTGPASNKAAVDGLGRLTGGFDTLTETSGSTIDHTLSFSYDRRSQLTSASITNIDSATWSTSYNYSDDGNLSSTAGSNAHSFTYDNDLLTALDAQSVTWDKNGRMATGLNRTMTWNWDHRLRSATIGSDGIDCKYSPDGAMAYKESTDGGSTTKRKFIVDRIGKIPVVLLVLDADDSDAIVKSYYHALGQTLAQRDGGWNADKYFYLQDRLGSVRQVCHYNSGTGSVVVDNRYTYDPFGNPLTTEIEENVTNPYRFANYVWDPITKQYYCNARWYDPVLARFTGRDPVLGGFNEPLTLHAYLYCLNDPVNHYDPTGKMLSFTLGSALRSGLISAGWNAMAFMIQNWDTNKDPLRFMSAVAGGFVTGFFGGKLAQCLKGPAGWIASKIGSVLIGNLTEDSLNYMWWRATGEGDPGVIWGTSSFDRDPMKHVGAQVAISALFDLKAPNGPNLTFALQLMGFTIYQYLEREWEKDMDEEFGR